MGISLLMDRRSLTGRQREAWKAGYNFREIGAEMWNKP